MDDYLSKPIARDDLRAMLEKYLGGRPPAGVDGRPPPPERLSTRS